MVDSNGRGNPAKLNRREFLAVSTAIVAGQWPRPAEVRAGGEPAAGGAARPPARSRVVRLRQPRLVDGPRVHTGLLEESLDAALAAFAGTISGFSAWESILHPTDTVGLKFNQSGRDAIATTAAMAEALVRSLQGAGVSAGQIICIEAPPGIAERLGVRSARPGYSVVETDFGSGRDHLAAVLDDISALISVPFLKTHNIAGFTGALKNLSHGLIKHPARFHANSCSPFIADIVGTQAIRSKLRLCVADGMRVVFDRGPEPTVETLSDEGYLLVSDDPVAVDSVGMEIVNRVRRAHGMGSLAMPEYLAAAASRGLGNIASHLMDFRLIDG